MNAQDIMDGRVVSSLNKELELYNSHIDQPNLSETLKLLYKIALDLKLKRLKSDAAFSYDLNDPEDSYCWQTHMLIEELMIWANNKVAEKIHTCYPDAALLRRQCEPNEEELHSFIDDHNVKSVASLSLALSNSDNLMLSRIMLMKCHLLWLSVFLIKSGKLSLLRIWFG